MAHKPWTEWTHEAIEQNERLPDVAPDDPTHTCLYEWTTRPNNWFPENAVERIRSQKSAKARFDEYAAVVFETIENAASWDDAPTSLPPWFGTDYHVAGEMYSLASRLPKGTMNELAARDWAEEAGYTVLTTEEALEAGDFENTEEMEKAEVDFMTEDGTKFQVKSSESGARKVENENVRVLIVNGREVREA